MHAYARPTPVIAHSSHTRFQRNGWVLQAAHISTHQDGFTPRWLHTKMAGCSGAHMASALEQAHPRLWLLPAAAPCSLLPAPCSLLPAPCSLLLLHAACSHRRREAASACSNPPHPAPRTHQQPHTLPSSHHFPSARTRSHRHLVYASWAPSVKGSAAVDAKTAHDDAAPMHALHMHDASLRCMNAYSHACMQPCMHQKAPVA